MATIKDVARLANVSLGTVSNVLNGKSVVNQKKADKVMSAVRELDYKPDAKARSLKTNKSFEVGVILPNILDKKYAQLYTGIERTLSENGYVPNLYISSELSVRENSIFDIILQHKTDGIIVISCQSGKAEVFTKVKEASIPIIAVERELSGNNFDFVGFDNGTSIHELVSHFLNKGLKNFLLVSGFSEYSNEKDCQQVFLGKLQSPNKSNVHGSIIEANQDKESAFRELMIYLNSNDLPDVIIATSPIILEGVNHAIVRFCGRNGDKPQTAGLCVDSWAENLTGDSLKVKQRPIELGVLAAEKLLEKMEGSSFSESCHHVLYNNHLQIDPAVPVNGIKKKSVNPVRILMLEGSATTAVSNLVSGFERQTGLRTEIVTYPFEKLFNAVIQSSKSNYYDVFMVDNPWITDLVQKKSLLNLDSFLNKNSSVTDQFVPGVLDAYAKFNGEYYALPFVFGTQLLFYRKDLFTDQNLQFEFYKQYRKKLRPPESWVEFNAVARFFTRKFNPGSPVEYGTTLGANEQTSAVCEFLPRLWAFQGEIFSREGVPIQPNRTAEMALANYLESFDYAAPGSVNQHWSEQVAQFNQGMSAMMVMFVAHAMDVGRKKQSTIAGNVGYALIPGKKPILGGWSLAINDKSNQPDNAFDFIQWATSKDLAVPYTILGGTTPCLDFYKSSELLQVYPWLTKSIQSFKICKKRELPSQLDSVLKVREYECLLGNIVNMVVKRELTVKEGVERLTNDLNKKILKNLK